MSTHVRCSMYFMVESITGRSNVVPYQNLQNLGSIPGVAVTYLTFKANTNICFDYPFSLLKGCNYNLLSKGFKTVTVNYVSMNMVTLLAYLVTALKQTVMV